MHWEYLSSEVWQFLQGHQLRVADAWDGLLQCHVGCVPACACMLFKELPFSRAPTRRMTKITKTFEALLMTRENYTSLFYWTVVFSNKFFRRQGCLYVYLVEKQTRKTAVILLTWSNNSVWFHRVLLTLQALFLLIKPCISGRINVYREMCPTWSTDSQICKCVIKTLHQCTKGW